jgi:hypothetical protein
MDSIALRAHGFPDLLSQLSTQIERDMELRNLRYLAGSMDGFSAVVTAGIAHATAEADALDIDARTAQAQREMGDMVFLKPDEMTDQGF